MSQQNFATPVQYSQGVISPIWKAPRQCGEGSNYNRINRNKIQIERFFRLSQVKSYLSTFFHAVEGVQDGLISQVDLSQQKTWHLQCVI